MNYLYKTVNLKKNLEGVNELEDFLQEKRTVTIQNHSAYIKTVGFFFPHTKENSIKTMNPI